MAIDLPAVPLRMGRFDRNADIVKRGQPGHQGKALEHDHPVQAWLDNLPAVQDHAACGGCLKTGQDVEQRTLATPRVTDQGEKFSLFDLERDILKDTEGVRPVAVAGRALAERKMLANVVDFKKRHPDLPPASGEQCSRSDERSVIRHVRDVRLRLRLT